MKKFVFTFSFVLLAVLAIAQPKIQFDKTVHDFQTISEEAGRQTGRFEFTNIGDSALTLTSVRPGCGCTAANYTKESVAPGEKGFIDATYDPRNRPGAFHKSISVTTNEPETTNKVSLSIRGTVEKRPPTVFEKEGYVIGSGMVRIKENSARIELKNTESHVDTFFVKNFWDKAVSIDYFDKPEYFSEVYRSFGKEIQAGEEGILVIKYDAGVRNAFGNFNDHLVLLTNDSIEDKKALLYNVTITEDFSKITEKQLKKAPKTLIDSTSLDIDFGQVKINATATQEITINNGAKKPNLIVRNVQPSSTVVTHTITPVIEGKTYTVALTVRAQGRLGKQNGTVDIITNDPTNPVITLKYSLEVSK